MDPGAKQRSRATRPWFHWRRVLLAGLIAVNAWLLAADPAGEAGGSAARIDLLRERVEAFWRLRIDGDEAEITRAYLMPAARDAAVTDRVPSDGPIRYHSFEIEKVEQISDLEGRETVTFE